MAAFLSSELGLFVFDRTMNSDEMADLRCVWPPSLSVGSVWSRLGYI